MVRPRADLPGPSAKERIERAFWSQLSEKDYSQMTVDSLCADAGINHNTLYYHFGNLDRFAIFAVGESAATSMACEIIPLFCGDVAACRGRSHVKSQSGFGRAISVAQNGSRALTSELVDSAIREWARAGEIDPDSLNDDELRSCRVVFCGVVAALSSIPRSKVVSAGADFGRSPLGIAFAKELECIKDAHSRACSDTSTLGCNYKT